MDSQVSQAAYAEERGATLSRGLSEAVARERAAIETTVEENAIQINMLRDVIGGLYEKFNPVLSRALNEAQTRGDEAKQPMLGSSKLYETLQRQHFELVELRQLLIRLRNMAEL